ncbi:MAG TPA: cupin domain-containing protein [Steroidobacter sp.]|uniref:cupin domain-containing protein n=1 Tax=Steroidobacter sp. TaxID=1978227 RepID=UPI002ED77915
MLNVSRLKGCKRIACIFLVCLLPAGSAGVFAQTSKSTVTATPLLTKELIGVPGKEAVMLSVEYLPGGESMPHRHDAQVFLYVVEGSIVTQVEGQAPVTLTAGQTFYEAPGDIHKTARNASKTEPAKLVVFFVKDVGKPISRPVAAN